jgi:tripartite-type tricarboxylate transporter receptor subunit TctC
MKPAFSVRALILTGLAAAVAAMALPTSAQNYPGGPVQIVVPYPQGGFGDIAARAIAEPLSKSLGQPVTVENRPGASGAAGAQSVARAATDGRTLLLGQTGEVVIQPYLIKEFGPRPEAIALVATTPLALVVQANAPYSSVKELLQASRNTPRGLFFASAGRLTPGHFAGELLRIRSGARLTHVQYEGGGPALNALVDGRVDFYFGSLPSEMPLVRSGKLKILAVSSAKRDPALPDVTTMQESDVSRFDVSLWAGVFAPRGTSRDIVTRLNRDIDKILDQPEVKDALVRDGAIVTPMSLEQFQRFVSDERTRYQDFIAAEFCSQVSFAGCEGFGAFVP